MIFLDTNILSYYFNGNIKIKNKITEALNKNEIVCLTSINVYEILKGFRWRGNKISNNIKHYEDIKQLELINWL
jgi:tRNA(fMet)-specific endonuclease VapC